ncbi:RNase P modulator RnpM [Desulfothermobacter acidiphilus]|uniref:RNase P modulator RnpM n=1 Tax=Desulfothermobacter acidiphilus TaxID=1938353 RepID=UPI003F89D23F
MTRIKRSPLRQCVACGAMKPKEELLRLVRTPEGEVLWDAKGKRAGRGAYLCPEFSCLELALKKKRLERVLGQAVPPEVVASLREELKRRCPEKP